MKAKFGVIGEQLVLHARGIDLTNPYFKPELDQNSITQKGVGSGITLMRNYEGEDIRCWEGIFQYPASIDHKHPD
ncbi:hypothetical protein AB4Z29_14650 [Paenibacillus sp. 2TAB23]|uniref:hypothetical protein n=1 Tax=Paenibacillus sp. 2TAB23 TaxID=3233004 RepID=UPI003F991B52